TALSWAKACCSRSPAIDLVSVFGGRGERRQAISRPKVASQSTSRARLIQGQGSRLSAGSDRVGEWAIWSPAIGGSSRAWAGLAPGAGVVLEVEPGAPLI